MKQAALRFIPGVLLAVILLGFNLECWAEEAEADRDMRTKVWNVLNQEGYIGQYRNGQELQRGVSAYLWDNRYRLRRNDFHNSRQFDVLACLLNKRGYPGFEQYIQRRRLMKLCQQVLK